LAKNADFLSLLGRNPSPSTSRLLSDLVPPREFSEASFDNYVPHKEFASQAAASIASQDFASGKATRRALFSRAAAAPEVFGIYLDGGFGVGKTHLLAAVYREFKGKKAFGSFIAFTSLIGALGFAPARDALSKYKLICIDEFELDDPGDTMIMSRLLNELSQLGVKFAATSNTPPTALGEGRFAADDFAREIHGISERFLILRIDGEDHRHRPLTVDLESRTDKQVEEWASHAGVASIDAFDDFLKHLSKVHPSKYGLLLEGIDRVGLLGAHVLDDQAAALRFVSFIDRAYEMQVAVRGSGIDLTKVFRADHVAGGYKKKYLRAISRLGALGL
jgi:cell division protein ZapE